MSHYSSIQTEFRNLFYLEKALNRLNIVNRRTSPDQGLTTNLVISRLNSDDVEFSWNGERYSLLVDISLWNKTETKSTRDFIDKIAQQYAAEVVVGESQKTGFQLVKSKQNSDNSKTLLLERFKFSTGDKI